MGMLWPSETDTYSSLNNKAISVEDLTFRCLLMPWLQATSLVLRSLRVIESSSQIIYRKKSKCEILAPSPPSSQKLFAVGTPTCFTTPLGFIYMTQSIQSALKAEAAQRVGGTMEISEKMEVFTKEVLLRPPPVVSPTFVGKMLFFSFLFF